MTPEHIGPTLTFGALTPKAQQIALTWRQLRSAQLKRDVPLERRPAALTSFARVATRIEKYEKRTGEIIDPVRFLKAHFWFYKTRTYPQRLLASFSFTLYHTFLQQRAPEPPMSNAELLAHDVAMVRRLAEIRGESERHVVQVLCNSDMLSPPYLASRGYRRVRGKWRRVRPTS